MGQGQADGHLTTLLFSHLNIFILGTDFNILEKIKDVREGGDDKSTNPQDNELGKATLTFSILYSAISTLTHQGAMELSSLHPPPMLPGLHGPPFPEF